MLLGVILSNSYGHEVYSIAMNSVSARIMITIAASKNMDVMAGDIGNVYLNANTKENIYTCAGAEVDLVGVMAEVDLL